MSDSTKTGFFEEQPGKRSMTRLISFALTVTVVAVILYQVYTKTIDRLFIAELLAAAIGTKHAGRALENRKP